MSAGILTPALPYSLTPGELLGNEIISPGVSRTVRVPLLAVAGGTVSTAYPSWVSLFNAVGSTNGQKAEVYNDPGTHTDPVTGLIVANSGVYAWNSSVHGWLWISPSTVATGLDLQSVAFNDTTRPGDNPHFYTNVPNGLPASAIALPSTGVQNSANGNVYRVTSPNINQVTPIRAWTVDASRVYLLKFTFVKYSPVSNPANGLVVWAVIWLDQSYNEISRGYNASTSINNLMPSDGIQNKTIRIAATGGDFAPPSNAVYFKPLIYMFDHNGADGLTDIIRMFVEDVTDSGAYSPDLSSTNSRVTALESLNLGTRVTTLESEVTSPISLGFVDVTSFQAATIPAAINYVTIYNYSGSDGNKFSLKRVSSAPSYPGYFTSANGAIFVPADNIIYAASFGVKQDGTTDDLARLTVADMTAFGQSKYLHITGVCYISAAYIFKSHPVFSNLGRIKPAANVTISFYHGFTAPLHHQVFDFSNNGSGILGYVTARYVTPQMFGAYGDSTSVDDAPFYQKAFDASVKSGLPLFHPPTVFVCKSPIVCDWGGAWGRGTYIEGVGGRSILNFMGNVSSPNLKHTSITGYHDAASNQYATFYGRHAHYTIFSDSNTQYSRVMQYGEANLLPNGNTSVYFNGLTLDDIVVKANGVNSSGGGVSAISTIFSGFTDCYIKVTANCSGAGTDGSIAMLFQHTTFTKIEGSAGNADRGIYLGAGPVYACEWGTFDLEVLNVGFTCRTTPAGNNKYMGTFASMNNCIDVTTSSGGMVFESNQFGGIASTYISNATATDGTFGGYGVVMREPQQSIVGMRSPTSSNDLPSTITAGTWYRNTYGQRANVSLFLANTDGVVDKRLWYDTSSGGVRRFNGGSTNYNFPLNPGESFRVQSSGAVSTSWISDE